MKRKELQKAIFITLIAILSTMAYSCSEDDMQLSYQHAIQMGVYSSSTQADTLLYQVTVMGDGAKEVMYQNVESLQSLFLIPNLNSNTTKFFINKRNNINNELVFYYRKKAEPVSGSGGITVNLILDSCTFIGNDIDSVVIVKPGVNYNESFENVKMYIHN